jgi:hypothetical protein
LLAERALPQAARIAGMLVVHLLLQLVPRDRDLLGVHDHDEIARVDMRRVDGLRLPAQPLGDLGRETAQGLPLGIHDHPVALNLTGLGVVGLHEKKAADTGSAGRQW